MTVLRLLIGHIFSASRVIYRHFALVHLLGSNLGLPEQVFLVYDGRFAVVNSKLVNERNSRTDRAHVEIVIIMRIITTSAFLFQLSSGDGPPPTTTTTKLVVIRGSSSLFPVLVQGFLFNGVLVLDSRV
jgi:hypothetical protein